MRKSTSLLAMVTVIGGRCDACLWASTVALEQWQYHSITDSVTTWIQCTEYILYQDI